MKMACEIHEFLLAECCLRHFICSWLLSLLSRTSPLTSNLTDSSSLRSRSKARASNASHRGLWIPPVFVDVPGVTFAFNDPFQWRARRFYLLPSDQSRGSNDRLRPTELQSSILGGIIASVLLTILISHHLGSCTVVIQSQVNTLLLHMVQATPHHCTSDNFLSPLHRFFSADVLNLRAFPSRVSNYRSNTNYTRYQSNIIPRDLERFGLYER